MTGVHRVRLRLLHHRLIARQATDVATTKPISTSRVKQRHHLTDGSAENLSNADLFRTLGSAE